MWQAEINGDTAVPIPPELLTLATGCLFATQPRPHMKHGEGPTALFTNKPAGQWWEELKQCGAHKPGRKCFTNQFKSRRWHLIGVNMLVYFPEWQSAGLSLPNHLRYMKYTFPKTLRYMLERSVIQAKGKPYESSPRRLSQQALPGRSGSQQGVFCR